MTDVKDITNQTEFDQVTLICTRCKAEHTTFPLQPLRTKDIKEWLSKNTVRFCDCDLPTCNAKFRIKGSRSAP